ncbi:hypothetical protein [uncultured Microscilla sp.]|uniref:hypothetical protein n=1 Tax=uncultured Microscilla sp. TaxID=432653 RepID=UPI002630B1A6|nr:hypothetical protein [uncultured Microscilla sp.]
MKIHTLYSDQYATSYYNPDLLLLETYWKKPTEDMTNANYQMVLLDTLDELERGIQQHGWRFDKMIADNRQFLFIMSPRLQEWQTKYIFNKLLGYGLKKTAIVMSKAFTSQFSIEQTFEESPETNEITKYFDDIQEARNWIVSEKVT